MMEKMADMGIFKQLPFHSRTSQYGQLSRFNKVDTTYIRKFLEDQYNSIQQGEFAKEWEAVKENDLKELEDLKEAAFQSDISLAEDAVKANLQNR